VLVPSSGSNRQNRQFDVPKCPPKCCRSREVLMKHRLYLKSALKLEQLAEEINRVALSGFTRSFRDGLNRGGGNYCSFVSENAEVLLVHNDARHPDMYD
jgi:hypothetical protein